MFFCVFVCFYVSPAIPQFGLLCHVSPLRLFSGHSSPVLTLRTNECYTSLPSPHSLLVDVGIWAPFPLVIAIRPVLCGFFPPQFFCPLRFPSSPLTHLWEGFLLCGNFSSTTPSPGWISIPKSFVSVLIFYILPYLLSKRLGCLSSCLTSSTSIQWFCGSFSIFKWSFEELLGEKVVSLSYSSTILGPTPKLVPDDCHDN